MLQSFIVWHAPLWSGTLLARFSNCLFQRGVSSHLAGQLYGQRLLSHATGQDMRHGECYILVRHVGEADVEKLVLVSNEIINMVAGMANMSKCFANFCTLLALVVYWRPLAPQCFREYGHGPFQTCSWHFSRAYLLHIMFSAMTTIARTKQV